MSEQAIHVIGTAGHVDHGKSTLVRALTGIDPDRLAEEKAREMTIDLGFAWLTLGEDEIGIVDVPGHRDFIENMLAGVGGIDLALFVIAADEGVMPQTREHLAILDLLQVRDGLIALTKIDLVDDEEWLELVALDIAEVLAGTALADAPIIPVSARTGAGLDALKGALAQKLAAAGGRPDNGRARLPIDRVFTLPGFGTVVTGTLDGGRLRLGDTLDIQPGGQKARVRGLQTHKRKLEVAQPGSRVAVNLTGVGRDEVTRGQVLAAPGALAPTILLDVRYRHLPGAAPLKHNVRVKLFSGAAEVVARTRVLGARQIEPGAEGWLQLALEAPIAVARGDRFILRRPSPAETIGGGLILDPTPGRRHRRFRPEVLERLETLTHGRPDEMLLQALRRGQPQSAAALLAAAGLDRDTAQETLDALLESGDVLLIGGQLLTRAHWQALFDQAAEVSRAYHAQNPLRLGIPREELRSRLRLSPGLFAPLLAEAVARGLLLEEGAFLRRPEHASRFSAGQQTAVNDLLAAFRRAGVNSPSVKDARRALGDDLYLSLVDQRLLRPLNADVVYEQETYERLVEKVVGYLKKNGRLDAAAARDLLDTSRKYAIALLEHLDDIKVTRRVDDYRELAP
jgi:selenocysteine-specific elongation factor